MRRRTRRWFASRSRSKRRGILMPVITHRRHQRRSPEIAQDALGDPLAINEPQSQLSRPGDNIGAVSNEAAEAFQSEFHQLVGFA
ncbi:hypothetical protein Enr13x_32410 [Stieleria neptunia]|uniref:Uncharacterized protein n=1 Tax=Stieleria neptunia TaxID=2527979 RepID=A0A518HRB5_9BACT|nr:hypothetical protein Enr13x_32410 [Stieleria neptunia]